jgi:hypothetical protein
MSKESTENQTWEIDPDFYQNLEYDVLVKILANGKSRFNNIYDELKEIRSKSFTVIAILISFLGILISSVISQIDEISRADYKVIFVLILVGLVITGWAITKLLSIIYPKNRFVPGEEPKTVDYRTMYETEIDQQLYAYLVNEIENIQAKITYNKRIVDSEISIFEHVLLVLPVAYFLLLAISILIIIF